MPAPTSIEEARRLFLSAPRWLALTGAGMSVDSGIPPFRGPGGLWEKFDPEEYAHVRTLERDPARAWVLFRILEQAIAGAQPHAGHVALAEAERRGRINGVATQNIDGLHQAAGSRTVIELHGTARRCVCHRCGLAVAPEDLDRRGPVPLCGCGGVIRPAVTLFGELLPPRALERSLELLQDAGRLLVIGTSAEVHPAAMIPLLALDQDLPVIVVGPDPTRLSGQRGVTWVRGAALSVLPALLAEDDGGPA
jgi:NAD-dependent deacetylase